MDLKNNTMGAGRILLKIGRMFLLCELLICSMVAMAQENKKFSGRITSSDNHGIEFVSVAVFDSDSLLVASCISDSLGYFKAELTKDSFQMPLVVKFNHIGYLPVVLDLSSFPGENMMVMMTQDEHVLDEVTVKGDWVHYKDGNMLVMVDQIPSAQKFQSDKLLKQLPGVIKSPGGSYTLNGKPVIFYVNGVKQNITDESLDVFLSTLPASVLSQVKLIQENNGKYPSGNDNAVIELKTKKNIVDGYSHQFTLSGGFFKKGLYSISPSYFYMVKKGRLLFYNSISFDDSSNYGFSTDSTRYANGDGYANCRKNGGMYPSVQYNARLTYTFPNDNQLDLSAFIYDDFGHIHSDVNTKNYLNGTFADETKGHYKTYEHDDMYSATLSYVIPDTKEKFNGIVYYNAVYGGLRSYNDYADVITGQPYENSKLWMAGWMHTLAADFSSKLEKWRLDYGINGQCNWLNDRTRYRYPDNTPEFNSHFCGREVVSALYTSVYYDLSKHFTLTGSIRMENTDYTLKYKSDGYNDHHNYTDWFPVVMGFINTKNYYATIGFRTGNIRPKYTYMLPGERKVTDTYYTKGNPELDPYKSYSFFWNSTFFKYLHLQLSYNHFKNVYGAVYYAKDNVLYQDVLNYADIDNYNVGLTLPFRFLKGKLYGQIVGNCIYADYRKFVNGYIPPEDRPTHYWVSSLSGSMNYDITDRLNFNLDAYYKFKTDGLDTHIGDWGNVDLNINYSFLKQKNLIVYLSADNLFDSQNRMRKIYFGDNFRQLKQYSNGPVFTLSVRLKFNKGQRVVDEYRDYQPDLSRLSK